MIYSQNLLQMYVDHIGESEIPQNFNTYCLYSLVAACVGDRVGFRYMPEALCIPNIYVFLVGPSGFGKNESIGIARKFVSNLPLVPTYEGRISGPMLMREIGRAQTEIAQITPEDPVPKLWLVAPELSFTVGEGPKAMDFIKIVTELFSMAGKNLVVTDSTLTYGTSKVNRPCLNWLAGTTVSWLKKSVSHEDIEGGFGRRVFMAYQEPDYSGKRVLRPKTPADYWKRRDEIQARLQRLTDLKGEFEMTTDAAVVEEQWYMNRPEPSSDLMAPWWKGEKELCLKMAMILSLCARDDLIITDEHMAGSQDIVGKAGRQLELMIYTAGLVQDHSGLDYVSRMIRTSEVIPHAKLQRMCMRKGLTSSRLNEALRTLVEAGQVHAMNKNLHRTEGWKGKFYEWHSRRIEMPMLVGTEGDEDDDE